ncbi:plexin domain-containing protein 1-like [Condylostylus longicornis]|uniref:plexin domain-containing protein 1-like n=1 Tax=Condylostylus longicornis TaxID=2530218 RepID=UPI00244DF167|nr:plexin domain-containing protein 1-like [Condylostylus longicornis]
MAGACDRLKILFVLYIIINLITDSSIAFEENINQYVIDSNLPYVKIDNIHFRNKRETETSYQNVQENISNATTFTQGQSQWQPPPQTIVISKQLVTSTAAPTLQKEEVSVQAVPAEKLNVLSTPEAVKIENPPQPEPSKITLTNSPTNAPLLGVNGTGQRKDTIVSEPMPATPTKKNTAVKKVLLTLDDFFNTVDISENKTREFIQKQNFTYKEENHIYYNSTQIVNETAVSEAWDALKIINPNHMLSSSHRRAITVQLKFDFPFYGHPVRNITVATGGFLYTGEYVHSWLAATQYIAPLMANFDTSLLNDSFVRYDDNGTAFSVLWENVSLQDRPEAGQFTFSATLHDNGDIVFTYFKMPIKIEAIQDDKHPVKVGLSDAYIIDKVIFFARRKTIYEYHRVNFNEQDIQNNTIIYLRALPTCLEYTDCESCTNHNTTFGCAWCPGLNKCSTGTDRKRQDWLQKGCDRSIIKEAGSCPPKGTKGNDASTSIEINHSGELENNSSRYDTLNRNMTNEHFVGKNIISDNSMSMTAKEDENKSNVGLALGLMIPICLIMTILIWMLYAYRNPHTKSGQLLIQYRPTQWSWRRGEARYTAATIHM